MWTCPWRNSLSQMSSSLCLVCKIIWPYDHELLFVGANWCNLRDTGTMALCFFSAHCFAFRCFAAPFHFFAGLGKTGRSSLIGFLLLCCVTVGLSEGQANKPNITLENWGLIVGLWLWLVYLQYFFVIVAFCIFLSLQWGFCHCPNAMVPTEKTSLVGQWWCSLSQPRLLRVTWPGWSL